MTVTATDGSVSGWNAVNLSGSLSGNAISGNTASDGAASGIFGMNQSASGAFAGNIFGPHANEVGAAWTLHDSSPGGKSAIGAFGAHQ